jgi:Zn-dependent protease with chaperone function
MTPIQACYRHPGERERARCGDCGRSLCAACFDAAAWPWKVCADCQPKREESAAAAATTAPVPAVSVAPSAAAPAKTGTILPASRGPRAEQVEEEELPQLKRGSFLRVFLFLAAVTLIPLLAWAVAAGIQGAYEAGIRPAGAPGLGVGRVTAAECRGSGSTSFACLGFNLAGFVMAATPVAVLVGPVLVIGIAVASWVAGRSRLLLLLLFVPGAYLTLTAMTLLVALQGAIVLATLFAVSSVTGGMFPFIVLGIGLLALLGVVSLVQATVTSIRPAVGGAFGVPISREQAPRLWSEVGSIADKLGAKPPTNIVLGIQPGFWVTEAKVQCLAGLLSGRTMYLSLAECRVLSRGELGAIVGHELAHFKGFDTRLSHFFYPVYRGVGSSLASMEAATEESWMSWFTMLPAQVVLEFFFWRFAAAEATIGRKRELAADKVGASVTSARTAATALVKVHAFDEFWTNVRGLLRGAFSSGKPVTNASLAYAELVQRGVTPALLEGLGQDRLPHPTDTHPTLDVRLHALGVTIHEVEADAMIAAPADPAIALIDEPEKIEEALSKDLPEYVAY